MLIWRITTCLILLVCSPVSLNRAPLNGSFHGRGRPTKNYSRNFIGRRIVYYPNSTGTFRIELIQHGDIHPNPGPVPVKNDKVEDRDLNRSASRVYTRNELLALNSNARVDSKTWQAIQHLGISRKRRTHRGVKGGRRVLRRRLQSSQISEKGGDQKTFSTFALWNARSVKNKSHMISDLVCTHHIDILAITETWLTGDARDNRCLAELNLALPSHQLIHLPRKNRAGGGIGVCLHRNFTVLQQHGLCEFESFEYIDLLISCKDQKPLRLIVVYRPQRKKNRMSTTPTFFEEFYVLLENLMTEPNNLVITGDFNFHVNNPHDRDAATFSDLITSVNLLQHIDFPTHVKGHTMDLLITRLSSNIISQISCTSYLPSDHAALLCKFAIKRPDPVRTTIQFLKIKDINLESFCLDIVNSKLLQCYADLDSCELVESYELTLSNILEKHAPLTVRTITARPRSPWYSEKCHEAKQKLRKLERRWRISRLEIDHQIFLKEARCYNQVLKRERRAHYSRELEDCGPRDFFQKVTNLCAKSEQTLPKDDEKNPSLANRFSTFFARKTEIIVSSLDPSKCPEVADVMFEKTDHVFDEFQEVSSQQVERIISGSKSSTCELDPMPTDLLKKFIKELAPVMTRIVNLVLSSGHFPD